MRSGGMICTGVKYNCRLLQQGISRHCFLLFIGGEVLAARPDAHRNVSTGPQQRPTFQVPSARHKVIMIFNGVFGIGFDIAVISYGTTTRYGICLEICGTTIPDDADSDTLMME